MTLKKKPLKKRKPLCSGFKCFPDGKKCKGCSDCVGPRRRFKDGIIKI